MKPLEGPAVQRPVLEGSYLAEVTVGGTTAIVHSFNDPRSVRGISRPQQPGHSLARQDTAIVYVDVPIAHEGPLGDISISVMDLSKLRQRPVDMAEVQALLGRAPKGIRAAGRITGEQLRAHPDWGALGLPGVPSAPRLGFYEIYRDRGKEFRWRLHHNDGRIVAECAKPYPNRAACEADLRWMKESGSRAPVRSLDIPSSPASPKKRK
ncbi:MAG: DUF1508 domain-containing protein [Rhodocyclaceae bacterium]|nr:DUF1508 domain-containing protein [Rhodocyclaceae bacterium]